MLYQLWSNKKLVILSLLGASLSIWLWFQVPLWAVRLAPSLPYQAVTIFEPRFTPEQVMQSEEGQGLFDASEEMGEAKLELYPYVLMEVKYLKGEKSLESTMLWSLNQGEVLLDTSNWDMTHGYYDCLIHRARGDEMAVVTALAHHGGTLDRESLLKAIHRDGEQVDNWIQSCIRKQLIVQIGNIYKLHLQNPKLAQEPRSKIASALRKRTLSFQNVITPKYSPRAIVNLAHDTFGSGFSIRRQQLVYLPVYSITATYPDGSSAASKWNAHTGKLLDIKEE